jgi:hypothetical protein
VTEDALRKWDAQLRSAGDEEPDIFAAHLLTKARAKKTGAVE